MVDFEPSWVPNRPRLPPLGDGRGHSTRKYKLVGLIKHSLREGPRRKVLVVDDVPSNRAVLADLLERLGFEVFEAADGQQGIQLAQEVEPDLILMDRWMPVLDGFEATRQMRQVPELQEMVVIAVSACVSKEDQAQSREVGIDNFIWRKINEHTFGKSRQI